MERYSGNHYYPRIASSLSKQFYDGECLAEALGGSGWGLTPEDMERYVDWLAESGINTFAFHIGQYQLNGQAVRDWPPSIPFGLNWKNAMKPLLEKQHKKWDGHWNTSKGILLVAPTRGVMSEFHPEDAMILNEHNGAGVPDTGAGRISNRFSDFVEYCYSCGMEYDVTEERMLEQYGAFTKNGFKLGNVVYHTVILGEGCLWEQSEIVRELFAQRIACHAEDFSWKFVRAGQNQILLPKAEEKVLWRCRKKIKDLRICAHDMPKAVYINGVSLGYEEENGQYITRIPLEVMEKSYQSEEVSVRMEMEKKESFVYLQGDFRVKNAKGYIEKDDRQLLGEPDFYLIDGAEEFDDEIDCADLISSGYPFYKGSIRVKSHVIAGSSREIVLPRVRGDCVSVWIDDKYYGIVWGLNGKFRELRKGFII